jgi:hypothetical protein
VHKADNLATFICRLSYKILEPQTPGTLRACKGLSRPVMGLLTLCMLHEYNVMYSVQCYPRFHIIAVGLGTYYLWIRGHHCTKNFEPFQAKRLTFRSF